MKNPQKRITQLIAAALGTCALAYSALALDVGVAWVGKSGMSNRVEEGMTNKLMQIGPDIKLEVRKELATMDDLKAAIADFEKSKKAMVIIRSSGVEYLTKNPTKIPTFVGGAHDLRALGAVKNLQAPEGNITGVTYALPVDTQFETFMAVLPKMKSVILLTEKGHPSGKIDIDNTDAATKKVGLSFKSIEISSTDEAIAAVKNNIGKTDAFIIGNQAKVFDIGKAIVQAAGNTPVLSYAEKPISEGAIGGFVPDDRKLGGMLAESIVDVMINKKPISAVPVKVDPKPIFYVNGKSAERLKVEIPFEILQAAKVVE